MTQAYKHVGLHIFSAFLHIWFEEVADVVLSGIVVFGGEGFEKENWKGNGSSIAATWCNAYAPASYNMAISGLEQT